MRAPKALLLLFYAANIDGSGKKRKFPFKKIRHRKKKGRLFGLFRTESCRPFTIFIDIRNFIQHISPVLHHDAVIFPIFFHNKINILISTSGKVDQDGFIPSEFLRQFHRISDGVGAFQGGNDAFGA